jgi:putative ABC transport system ATP-binding protein
VLQARSLTKTYARRAAGKTTTVHALREVDLSFDAGEHVVIHGASGSGKSTLLLMLGGMLSPTAGTVSYDGQDIYAQSTRQRNHYRRSVIGFIFQKFYLLPYLSVQDNIRLPLALQGNTSASRDSVVEIAERLGVAERLDHRPSELSVGEQQRVAMARTLVARPSIILADEPTGNLDSTNANILATCLEEERGRGCTVILATHDDALMLRAERRVEIQAGRVID